MVPTRSLFGNCPQRKIWSALHKPWFISKGRSFGSVAKRRRIGRLSDCYLKIFFLFFSVEFFFNLAKIFFFIGTKFFHFFFVFDNFFPFRIKKFRKIWWFLKKKLYCKFFFFSKKRPRIWKNLKNLWKFKKIFEKFVKKQRRGSV